MGEHVFAERLSEARGSSREVYAAIDTALDRAGLGKPDINCVAFGNGPGSFTGVRVATSAAQALAFALDVPVIAVSTLAALAVEAGRVHGAEPVAVALDARMGEAYVGLYGFDAHGVARPLRPDALADPTAYSLDGVASEALAAGPGWAAYPEMAAANEPYLAKTVSDLWPSAAAVAVEARELFRQGKVMAAHEALPNYVRNKVTS